MVVGVRELGRQGLVEEVEAMDGEDAEAEEMDVGDAGAGLVASFGCHASKQRNSMDQGLIFSLPIPYCAHSLLYVDFILGPTRFCSDDSCLLATCGLISFTRAIRQCNV